MTRPRLQLHLSTLVVGMLLAAGLMWLNVQNHSIRYGSMSGGYGYEVYGWPTPCMFRELDFAWDELGRSSREVRAADRVVRRSHSWEIAWRGFAINIVVFFVLLAIAAVAIERLTRRMKRGATP